MPHWTNNPNIPSPCYVLEEAKLIDNLKLMANVQAATGVDIILALKGFSMWSCFDIVSEYLQGGTASALWEAKLAKRLGKQVHAFSPAFKTAEVQAIVHEVDHISFNSLAQYLLHKDTCEQANVSIGLRVNPEHQEADTPLYDPCAPGSRLGITAKQLLDQDLSGIEGFHIHALCECDSYATERMLNAIEQQFSEYFPRLKWLNLGGGHLMTQAGYNVEHLIDVLNRFKAKYPHLHVILEPGSAVAWQTGPLIAEVVDIVENNGPIAILDISVTAHMPDVLEMPYRPMIKDAQQPNMFAYTYRLGGNSCLAGDMLPEYSFAEPITVGQRIVFEDMMHYTMVKTTFFNGVQHPSIGILRQNGEFDLIREFTYEDFLSRLS
jgi:carboxynorspermidine decarboxylase